VISIGVAVETRLDSPDPELSFVIPTPAEDGARLADDADVRAADGDRNGVDDAGNLPEQVRRWSGDRA
jgi:hypothetical protein